MTAILFYVALVANLVMVYQMTRVHRLLLQHRYELLMRLGDVMQALPEDERADAHRESLELLSRQQLELERLRPIRKWLTAR